METNPLKVTCPDCDGKGGWGHGSTAEYDYHGKTSTRATTSRFFACESCNGAGRVTESEAMAINKAYEARQRQEDQEDREYYDHLALVIARERREQYEADMSRTTTFHSNRPNQ
jgi:hypothetical protein